MLIAAHLPEKQLFKILSQSEFLKTKTGKTEL